MGKLLKLTSGDGSERTELVNSEEINRVEPNVETESGFFSNTERVSGSMVEMKNGSSTWVAETPEQIYDMVEGVQT